MLIQDTEAVVLRIAVCSVWDRRTGRKIVEPVEAGLDFLCFFAGWLWLVATAACGIGLGGGAGV